MLLPKFQQVSIFDIVDVGFWLITTVWSVLFPIQVTPNTPNSCCTIYFNTDQIVRHINALGDNLLPVSATQCLLLTGTSRPSRGYASFKFLPGTDDSIIVAIKSEEIGDAQKTFFTVFGIDGKVILDDVHIADAKYEGLEFIDEWTANLWIVFVLYYLDCKFRN